MNYCNKCGLPVESSAHNCQGKDYQHLLIDVLKRIENKKYTDTYKGNVVVKMSDVKEIIEGYILFDPKRG
jgi:hypothetical protein